MKIVLKTRKDQMHFLNENYVHIIVTFHAMASVIYCFAIYYDVTAIGLPQEQYGHKFQYLTFWNSV